MVWNCSGYEEVSALRLLDGIVDIYMPDAKFWERVMKKSRDSRTSCTMYQAGSIQD